MNTRNFPRLFPKKVFLKTLIIFSLFIIQAPGLSAQPGATLQSSVAKTLPTLDGRIESSEWSDARKVSKTFNLINIQGQKTESHLFTLYIKNDDKNLYLAGRLDNEEHDGVMAEADLNSLTMDTFGLNFDNNNNGELDSGEDKKSFFIINQAPFVMDEHRLSWMEKLSGTEESDEPQNIKGQITHSSESGGYYQFELSIPLNSGDSLDFQLQPGHKIRFNLFYFDKFSVSMKEMGFAGWFSDNTESSEDWGYLQLADTQGKPPATAMAPVPAKPTPRTSAQPTSKASASQDIQVFAQIMNEKDLKPENLKFVGSHFDFVLSSFPFKKFTNQLKHENPNLLVFFFTNPYFVLGDKFWNASSQSEVKAAEQMYSLKTSSNKIIHYGGPTYGGMGFDQNLPLMDIRNPKWQNYFSSQVRKHIDLGGMDGVFLDTMDESLPAWAMAPGNILPKGYTHGGWKQANHSFLKKIIDAFAGTDLQIIYNGMSRVPGDKGALPNREMLDVTDGTTIESYGVYMSIDKNDDTKRWYFYNTILQDLKSISALGKKVLIEVSGDKDDEATRLYALTSFLMVQNAQTYFYFTKQSEAGGLHWRPEWDAKLGKPLGSYQEQANRIHSREFTNGKVLVNPNNTSMTIELSGKYKNWKGDRVGTSLSLPAYSGALLLNN